jgi:hypothetical protein
VIIHTYKHTYIRTGIDTCVGMTGGMRAS